MYLSNACSGNHHIWAQGYAWKLNRNAPTWMRCFETRQYIMCSTSRQGVCLNPQAWAIGDNDGKQRILHLGGVKNGESYTYLFWHRYAATKYYTSVCAKQRCSAVVIIC